MDVGIGEADRILGGVIRRSVHNRFCRVKFKLDWTYLEG